MTLPFRLILGGMLSMACVGAAPMQRLSDNGKPYLEIPPAPKQGFNYPYLIFTPPQREPGCFRYLLVEMTNDGGLAPDDRALEKARDYAARVATHWSLGNELAQRFATPLIVPVFPRPSLGQDSDLDTWSLTRAALFASGRLKRIDLQLAAMIADAQTRLREAGRQTDRKVVLTGFSASGLFASRFTVLHLDLVLAAVFGGLNSFITAPVASWHGHNLRYPLGLADYAAITGHAFDAAAYAAIPQLAFQGENDNNDAVTMDDDYTTQERDLIWAVFGKSMYPQRWAAIQEPYRAIRASLQFRVYGQIGHSFDLRALGDAISLIGHAAKCPAAATS
jgi:dienelactone hydrolase